VARRHSWLFVVFGVVVVIGIGTFFAGERARGAFFIASGAVGLWQVWIVSGGGRIRPSPRLVAVAKHVPLLILLFVEAFGSWLRALAIWPAASQVPDGGGSPSQCCSWSRFCSPSGVPFATSVETCPHVRSRK
jgi:hypothetical protein